MMHSEVGSTTCDLKHIYLLHFLVKAQRIRNYLFCKLNVMECTVNHPFAQNQLGFQEEVQLNQHDCSLQLSVVVFDSGY